MAGRNQSVLSYNISEIEDAFFGESLNGIDIGVVILYFISVLAVGIWGDMSTVKGSELLDKHMRRLKTLIGGTSADGYLHFGQSSSSRSHVLGTISISLYSDIWLRSMKRTNRSTVGGYFLAGRSISWWPVGASLFSSNVGSGHFVGLSGSGAATGIAVGTYEWNAMFVVLILAWVFLPVYIASGVVTMPEYLKKRFGGKRLQICIACLYLFIYIFTKIAVDLYAGAIFIHEALKWDLYLSVSVLLIVTAFYTIGGGLAAVIYTDTLQTFIMLLGALILMIVGFVNTGGYFGLVEKYMNATPEYILPNHPECGIPRNDSFHVFREAADEDFPWTGVVLGMPILSIWYWCSDQVIVQRTLAAKNLTHAKGGAILCSYLKILPMFMMVMVGMISRANFPEQVGCVVPEICSRICGNPTSCSDIAYPKMVMEYLPTGARGLMMSVVLAALMSSLTSIFNSSSTLFTIDLWQKTRPKASERELMIVGRVFVIFLVVLSVLWIPVIQAQEGGQLFTYIQKVSSYFQPPIAACFLLAVFWKRTNEKGAFWGITVGIIIGLIKMILDFVYPPPPCGQDDIRPSVVKDIHYLHFAIILAVVTAIVTVLISLLTKSDADQEYNGLTWWTRHSSLTPVTKTEKSALVSNDEISRQYDDIISPQTADIIMNAENDKPGPMSSTDLGQPDVIPRFQLPVETATFDGSQVQLSISQDLTSDHYRDVDVKSGHIPLWKKALSFICGLDDGNKTKNKLNDSRPMIQTLEEDPFWERVVNYNLIACVIVAISLWVIFR